MNASADSYERSFKFDRLLIYSALTAMLFVLAMFVTISVTGTGQDPLQYVRAPADYRALLLHDPPALRAIIGLDNGFVVAYSTVFLALSSALWRTCRAPAILGTALALLLLTSLLDLIENLHFLTMISAAEHGQVLGALEINLQVLESLVKFHVSYVGLFLLGVTLHARTGPERALRALLLYFQAPVGLLIYVVPSVVATPLVYVRFSFFFFSLLLLAWIFQQRGFGSNAPA